MSDLDELRSELRKQGAKRRQFKRLRNEAARELATLVPQARAQGLTIKEIGDLTDLTGPSVYHLLRQADAS